MSSQGYNTDVSRMYRHRFEGMADYRVRMWEILCADWFQQFVPEDATVIEIAAGHCEFINAIRAARRIAVDINPDTADHAADDVEVVLARSDAIAAIEADGADVVFMSNFLEHLDRDAIVATFRECHRVLKPGGRLMILQPNIRFSARDYWMFFDHVTPIDDRAVCEVLELNGFRVTRNIPRFLPYTTQSRLPKALWLLKLYLKAPLLWRFFGGQAFIVAEKA